MAGGVGIGVGGGLLELSGKQADDTLATFASVRNSRAITRHNTNACQREKGSPISTIFLFSPAFCEPSKKSSTYRTPPSPQKSHYGLAASWGQPVIRLKTLRRRRRVRHCRTRRALCVFFLSFFFSNLGHVLIFLPTPPHPEHDVNQLYLEISSLEVH